MARSRNIKPGFFANDELAEVEPLGRLLFAGLWTLADREGRLLDRPKRIKAEVMAYDVCNIDDLLGQLADRGFIIRYCAGRDRLIQIATWSRHQNPHKNEPPSILAPCDSDASTVQAPEQHSSDREDQRPKVTNQRPKEAKSTRARTCARAGPPPPPERQGRYFSRDELDKLAAFDDRLADRLADSGAEYKRTAADNDAILASPETAELLAEAVAAVFDGTWGDDFLREALNVGTVAKQINGYKAVTRGGRRKHDPKTGRFAKEGAALPAVSDEAREYVRELAARNGAPS